MKLYFYSLHNEKGSREIRLQEGEAEEKQKTYESVNGSFPGLYKKRLNKVEIGIVIASSLYDTVVLTQRDDERARNTFMTYYEGISTKHNQIAKKFHAYKMDCEDAEIVERANEN